MNKYTLYLITFLIAIILPLTGCVTENETENQWYIGTWVEQDTQEILTFQPNNTVKITNGELFFNDDRLYAQFLTGPVKGFFSGLTVHHVDVDVRGLLASVFLKLLQQCWNGGLPLAGNHVERPFFCGAPYLLR